MDSRDVSESILELLMILMTNISLMQGASGLRGW